LERSLPGPSFYYRAIKVPGIASWIHHSHIKAWNYEEQTRECTREAPSLKKKTNKKRCSKMQRPLLIRKTHVPSGRLKSFFLGNDKETQGKDLKVSFLPRQPVFTDVLVWYAVPLC
jgi:hypothetical protein